VIAARLNRSTIGSFSPFQGRNGNAKIRARVKRLDVSGGQPLH
jgi:hypothetical protein